jgi:hypothetical protein
MKTIWKYELNPATTMQLLLPRGTKLLSVQTQQGKPMLWALVDPLMVADEVHDLRIFGTGHDATEVAFWDFLGTFQLMDGRLVFHVFHHREAQP